MTCRRHALRSAAADASDTAVAAESSLVRSTARVISQFPLMADASDRVYALRYESAFVSLGLLSDSFFIIVVFASAASASEDVASLRRFASTASSSSSRATAAAHASVRRSSSVAKIPSVGSGGAKALEFRVKGLRYKV